MVVSMALTSQPLRTNSVASQSRSCGWVGGSPWVPKSSSVVTMPLPKSLAQRRFTVTRAVSGFSSEVIQRAKPSRLAGAPCGKGWNAVGTAAVTRRPRFLKFPLL